LPSRTAFDLNVADPPIENPGDDSSPCAANKRSPLGSVTTAFGRDDEPQSLASSRQSSILLGLKPGGRGLPVVGDDA
jgi:hypothetical protein